MLAILGVASYVLGQNTVKQDPMKQYPGQNFTRETAVLQKFGYPPGLLHTDIQDRAAFQTKDETDVRLPFGPNPQSKDVNIYGVLTDVSYQKAYLDNLRNLQVRTSGQPLIEVAFNSPLNNYDQQGHQVIYPAVQNRIAEGFENLNNLRPRFSELEQRKGFFTHDGQGGSTYLPHGTK